MCYKRNTLIISRWYARRLVGKSAPIDVKGLPRDERRVVRSEKGASCGDFLGQAQPPNWNAGGACGRGPREGTGIFRRRRSVECAGNDMVHEDVVLGEFGGQCAGEAERAHF